MQKNLMLYAVLVAILCSGCTERPLDAKSAKPSPSRPPGAATPSFQVIPAPNTPHTIGKYDSAARTLTAEKGQVGALMFGPYARLLPGAYRATFKVSAEADRDGLEVGALDVSGFLPAKSEDLLLMRVPLKAAAAEQSVAVDFEAKNPEHLHQFRVWTNGKANRVIVKNVMVEGR